MTRNYQTIKVVTASDERRRRCSLQEKGALVKETYELGVSVSLVARKHGISAANISTGASWSDNGGAFRATETHALAHQLGIEPVHTSVYSLQSNGMTESFVNTFTRDYVGCMDCSSGNAGLAQLPDASRHFNKVHPHSALGYKSPRMFKKGRRRRALGTDAN